jgi:hypothetical protein
MDVKFANLGAMVTIELELGTLFIVHNALKAQADDMRDMLSMPNVSGEARVTILSTIERLDTEASYVWQTIDAEKARQGREG